MRELLGSCSCKCIFTEQALNLLLWEEDVVSGDVRANSAIGGKATFRVQQSLAEAASWTQVSKAFATESSTVSS